MILHRSLLLSAFLALLAVSASAQPPPPPPPPPIPTVTIVQPAKDALIGSNVTFCVKFRNAGPVAGFGPFVDFVFPAGGADFNTATGPCDGATFVSARVTSTTPPVPLVPESPIATATPCGTAGALIPHPYANSGVSPVTVPVGQLAGQLVVVPLPFGSFEPNQPEMIIEVTAKIHPFADNGFPLPVYARGGFRYGADALDNHIPDPPVLNPSASLATGWPVQNLTPRVVVIHKQFPFPDDETVAGPNFPKNYAISVDVAPGQTVTNLQVKDCLPPSGVWNPTVSSTPPATTAIATNCLTLTWLTLTGSAALPTATASPGFWINNGPPPVAPPACAWAFNNTANITGGSWTPTDPRDLVPPSVLGGSAAANITKKALAIQKSSQVTTPNGAIPGANIHETLSFQVSDYLRFGNIIVTDTLSGGQLAILPSAVFRVKDRFGGWSPWSLFPPTAIHTTSNVTHAYTCPPSTNPCQPAVASGGTLPGGFQIQFNVSQAMIQHVSALPMSQSNGILTGGLVAGPPSTVGAEGQIAFDVTVRDKFVPPIPGDDGFVDKDDPLLDSVVITAKQYQNLPVMKPPPTCPTCTCSDTGSSCLAVPSDTLVKEVVAINGVWLTPTPNPIGGPNVTRGDNVTYRLDKTIPSGDAQNVTIRDFYPLPIFTVPPMVITQCPLLPTFSPPPGSACWRGAPNGVTVAPDSPPDNGITYTLGTFNSTANAPITIEILSTVQVTNAPFADGLLFTNEAQECENNSYGTQFCQAAIAQIKLQEPSLKIRKSILCAPGCNGTTCPSPTTGCPRSITYPVTSATLPSLGVGSVHADAGDRITFLVSIENIGTGPNGAFDVKLQDLLGPSFPGVIDTTSICVTNGTGVTIPNILTPSTTGWSIELVDGVTGSLAPFPSPSGANIALIVFDVVLNAAPNVIVPRCDDNTATLTGYSNLEGGLNFVAFGFPTSVTSTATVCIQPANLVKSIVSTSEAHTTGTDVTIGEIVRYDLTFDVPEGVIPPITITDSLPADLEMDPAFTPASLTTSNFTNPPSLPLTLPNLGTPPQVKFQIPSFTNLDSNPDCEQIHVRFNALVMNTLGNHEPDTKPNTATLQAGTLTISSPPVVVHIVEPKLTITKTLAVVGNARPFVVTVTNTSSVTAFDVVVSDTKPACFGPLTITSPTSFVGGNPSALPIGNLAPLQSVTIMYTGTQLPNCNSCPGLVNTATVTWTSLPGNGTPNGTGGNSTGDSTPGPSGAANGERNGSGTGQNNYVATAQYTLCGKVCGTKFSDINGNGVRDLPGDVGLGGWTINAQQGTSTIGSTTTAADGTYCLELPFGSYNICEQPQASWMQTLPASGACYNVQVTPSTSLSVNNDFGNSRTCVAQLCGTKETPTTATQGVPLPGWVIYAVPNQAGNPVVTAMTDANGSYCLSPLIGPGSYTVQEVPQNGWEQFAPTASSVTVQIDCQAGPNGTFTGVASPNTLAFVNQNVCAGITCQPPQHCVAQNVAGVPAGVCITDPVITPCAVIRCRTPFHCTVVNGTPMCLP